MTRNRLILVAAGGSAALLLGALAFQYIGGLAPCALCLWQRWPHLVAVIIGALALGLRGPVLPVLGALAVLGSAGIAGFHVGVEQGWWVGLASCSGGSLAGISTADKVIYRTMPVQSMKVAVVVPEIENYRAAIPERTTLADAVHNLSRVPLLTEALRAGDLKLIGNVLDDKLRTPALATRIDGFAHVVEIARRAGAVTVTISGDGPALVAFAERDHEMIGEVMVAAFANVGVTARSWVLPVDTQGVVISAAQSA